ncbi:hypothetical protein EC957_010987 [Mortierella hygrophila]|uniref:Protein kinase domain-containing protein n=1 Tax=Mortierella hygrophila TaxID=979708 RepID=A0A9P6JXH3_9FUNG|nr:hypothetical protein EC957_010987 [Mortierella hygrophila]
MTDNHLTLFCLVDGEATSKAFSVKVPSSDTVDDLKELIKDKKPVDFEHVDANNLTLWHVAHPVIAANKHQPVLLNTIDSPTELDPTDDIADVFAEIPPKKTIHILVQRPPQAQLHHVRPPLLARYNNQDMLSMSDVLNRILPTLRYSPYMSESTTTMHSAFSRTPTEALEWTQFRMQATSLHHPASRRFRLDEVRFNPHLLLSNEESVSSALDANVYEVLNRQMSVGRIGMYPEAEVVGKPDRVYYQSPRDAGVLIEVKTNRALACDDLVAKYREDMDLVARNEAPANPTWRQVHQIFGYLSHNNLRATYISLSFPTKIIPLRLLHRPPPPDLDDDDGDNGGSGDSDHSGYQGRKQHAGKQGQRHSSIITRSKSKIRQILRGQSRLRQLPNGLTVAVGKLYLHEFEIQEVLGEGRNGRVSRAMWGDEQVALKTCDLYKNPEYEDEMLTEVAVYEVLKVLQGVCIPHIKAAGYDGGIFVVAMEIVGSPMEVDTLSHEERLKIVDHLSLIHQHGIVHNDIRPHNILVRRCDGGFQVRFVDFSLSRRTYDKHALKKETIQLECLLWPSGRT